YFFFFQAEDGIRDFHVTGVQTCALPISPATADTAACSCVCGTGPLGPRLRFGSGFTGAVACMDRAACPACGGGTSAGPLHDDGPAMPAARFAGWTPRSCRPMRMGGDGYLLESAGRERWPSGLRQRS